MLIPVTLGWIVPWRTVRLQKALFDDTCFGDKAFTFTGRAAPLYRRFWLVWLSAIVLFIGSARRHLRHHRRRHALRHAASAAARAARRWR